MDFIKAFCIGSLHLGWTKFYAVDRVPTLREINRVRGVLAWRRNGIARSISMDSSAAGSLRWA